MARPHEQQPNHPRRFPVSVVLERRPASSPWAEHVWTAVGIMIASHAEAATPRLIRLDDQCAHFLVGGLAVNLYTDECESYYYNLVSDSPRAYVLAHMAGVDACPEPFRVSMSFDEAHAYLEGDDEVFAVDVPGALYRWTEAFVIANYFPQKKTKRKLRDWSADESGSTPS